MAWGEAQGAHSRQRPRRDGEIVTPSHPWDAPQFPRGSGEEAGLVVCAHAQLVADHLRALVWLPLPARLLGPCPQGGPLGEDPSASKLSVT